MRHHHILTGLLATVALAACGTSAAVPADTTTADTTTTADEITGATVSDAWDETAATSITLADGASTTESNDVTIEGDTVTITAGGWYHLAGSLTDGQLVIDTVDDGDVQLLLDGVQIASSSSSALSATDVDNVTIYLADGTESSMSDGTDYVSETTATTDSAGASDDTDTPNAAIYSSADLTITGNGSLEVVGNANDGITSKDDLVIEGGTIVVTAADDALRGKDSLTVNGGTLTLNAGGHGLVSDNESTAEGTTEGVGIITLNEGTLDITARTDGFNAVHDIVVNGGSITASVTDDAFHADGHLTIAGGEILVTASYEGLESAIVTITGGTTNVTSSDDGLNVAGGTDASGQTGPGGGRGGQDSFVDTGEYYAEISGGTLVLHSEGDGLDSNGSLTITGGTVVVNGPTSNGNGAIDVNGAFLLSDATLVAAGSSGMAETPDTESNEAFLDIGFQSAIAAGTEVQISDSDGNVLYAFESSKPFSSFVFAVPELENGATYTVTLGGEAAGTVTAV